MPDDSRITRATSRTSSQCFRSWPLTLVVIPDSFRRLPCKKWRLENRATPWCHVPDGEERCSHHERSSRLVKGHASTELSTDSFVISWSQASSYTRRWGFEEKERPHRCIRQLSEPRESRNSGDFLVWVNDDAAVSRIVMA